MSRDEEWLPLLGEDTLDDLLDQTAESMGYEGHRGSIAVTQELRDAVTRYEVALAVSLEACLRRMGRLGVDDLVQSLLSEGDASRNVLMTLRGEGVGIWDGRWDAWFRKGELSELQLCLEKDLRQFADVSGSGDVNDAMVNAVFESIPDDDAEHAPNYRRNVRGSGDPVAARELVLFIDNTNGLSLGGSHGQGKSVRENLLKKVAKGTYDFEKSVKLMGYLADAGAKEYCAGSKRWHETFDAPTRRLAARELAEQFREAANTGEYSPNARRTSSARYAAYFEAPAPWDFRWLMRTLLDMDGVEHGPPELQREGFRDAPLVFPFDPRKNARVSDTLSAAGGKIDLVWKLTGKYSPNKRVYKGR